MSQLANRFVSDAREIVKTGDIVKVRVVEVDVARKRIALTMKLDAAAPRRDAGTPRDNRFEPARPGSGARVGAGAQNRPPEPASAMASAFAKLQGPNKR